MSVKIPKEQKEVIIENIQRFFEEEDMERIGSFQAEALIHQMIKEIGPYIYNQAIKDARKLVLDKLTNIEEDLYVLEKPIR